MTPHTPPQLWHRSRHAPPESLAQSSTGACSESTVGVWPDSITQVAESLSAVRLTEIKTKLSSCVTRPGTSAAALERESQTAERCVASAMESATTTSSKTVTRGASRRHPPMQAIKVVVDASAGGSSARATPRDRVEIRTMSRSSTSVGKSEEGSRVPVVRVVGIFWNQECSDLCASGFEWPEGVRKLWFGFPDVPLEDVPLPESLKELIFVDTNFSTNEDKVVCPERLKPLVFNWKRPHVTLYDSHGALPPSRSEKTGDAHFTAPTSDDKSALWPQSRREFSPRVYFIQPLLNIKWPRGLEKIEWSREFIPPVEMIPWPDGLRQLVFGWNFNQSLIHVQWPDSLESIAFKFGFSQPLAHPTTGQSLLPRGLRKLKLGFCRKGMLTHSALPEGLRELVCSTIQVELSTVRWPSGLTDVCFDCVRSGGIFGGFPTLPPNLERLRVGNCFGGSGGRRSFPATMKELTVRAW